MRNFYLIIIVLFLNGCASDKELGKISISLREKNKTINIYENNSLYYTDASLMKSEVLKQDYKDFIMDGSDIVIVVKFDNNDAILSSTDSRQIYTTFIEIKNFAGNNCNIELDTSRSRVYTKFQAYLKKKYFTNPDGTIKITRKGNDSLLVKMHLKYADEMDLQGEFISVKDKQKSKFY